jgi:hypothetical protein
VAVSERVALFVSAARVDESTVSLVRWAFGNLVGDERVLVEPNPPELERRLRWGAVSREQLSRLFHALRARPSLGRFGLRTSRLSRDGESAILIVRDGESDVNVRLVTQPAFETPRVRALLPDDAALARELGQALRRELRGGT